MADLSRLLFHRSAVPPPRGWNGGTPAKRAAMNMIVS
jgi:hypothetical protein